MMIQLISSDYNINKNNTGTSTQEERKVNEIEQFSMANRFLWLSLYKQKDNGFLPSLR